MSNKALAPADGTVTDIQAPRTAVVEFQGNTYAVPKDTGTWSIEVMEALENLPMPRTVNALQILLGEEQWKAWRSRHTTMADVNDMYAEIGKVTGGNS